MNERYQTLYNEDTVTKRIGELAANIIERHRDDNPLFVALPRGAMPFSLQLMTSITKQAPSFHPELDLLIMSHNRNNDDVIDTEQIPEVEVVTGLTLSTKPQDRLVILIDALLDLGKTPQAAREYLKGVGARSIELAVLVQKDIAEQASEIRADYVGFHTSAQWLAGMGMKDGSVATEAYRWTPEILELKPNNDQPQHALIG